MASQEHNLVAVGATGRHQFVFLVDTYGNDATRHDIAEVLERRLFDGAAAGGKEDKLALLLQVAHGQQRPHVFAWLQGHQAGDGFAFARRADLGNLIHLERVHPPGVGEDQHVVVGGGDEQALDEILLARAHAFASGASTPLLAIRRDWRPLKVAGVADRDRNLFIRDQVFEAQFDGFVLNDRSPDVAVFLLDLFQFLDDDVAQLLLRRENGFVLSDAIANFGQLLEDFVDREARQTVQLQFQNGVGLGGIEGPSDGRWNHALQRGRLTCARRYIAFGHINGLAGEVLHQVDAGVGAIFAATDDADDIVHAIERCLVTLEDVFAVARLLQQEGRAPAHHVDAVIDEVPDGLHQAHFFRLAVDHGQEDHAEALLHRGVLEELVEHDLRFASTLEVDDDTHAIAVAVVVDVSDFVNDLVIHQFRNALDEA